MFDQIILFINLCIKLLYKNKKINIKKRKGNVISNEDYELKEIINLNNQIKAAIKYIYNLKKDKKNIHELLLEMTDNNNKNIVTGLKVEFTRKNKYIKDLYIIMTEDMVQNIKEEENIQFFSDTTYYCIPPQCKSLKMWIMLSYNKKYNKILICNISLIKNKNLETFKNIISYLKETYNFNPKIMTVNFCKAAYIAFKNIYKDIVMVPCFFHLLQSLILHLPQYKDQITIKNNAKNIIINMKIL